MRFPMEVQAGRITVRRLIVNANGEVKSIITDVEPPLQEGFKGDYSLCVYTEQRGNQSVVSDVALTKCMGKTFQPCSDDVLKQQVITNCTNWLTWLMFEVDVIPNT